VERLVSDVGLDGDARDFSQPGTNTGLGSVMTNERFMAAAVPVMRLTTTCGERRGRLEGFQWFGAL
jgi:hypothetical protein